MSEKFYLRHKFYGQVACSPYSKERIDGGEHWVEISEAEYHLATQQQNERLAAALANRPKLQPVAANPANRREMIWGWAVIAVLVALAIWRGIVLSQTHEGRAKIAAEERAWDHYTKP